MPYSKEIYTAAAAAMEKRRVEAERAAQERRTAFYAVCPRGEAIDHALAKTAIAAGRAVLAGANAKAELLKLKDENQRLQGELADLLKAHSLPQSHLDVKYSCAECSDTGYIDGRRCACLKTLLKDEACRQLSALTPLALSSFESFNAAYYSDDDRAAMERVLAICKHYSREFSASSQSLIFMGATGLGKTHLSLAIANEVIAKGFGVVYGSAGAFVERLEAAHFGRAPEDSTFQTLKSCDLLILDDLGTEFRTAFSTSKIYEIINHRQMAGKPAIISTNLSMKELEERYTERFASRILGGYTRLLFRGGDVRLKKRMGGANEV